MFETGQILQERYQLQQPLGRSPQVRQSWLAIDLDTDLHELVVIKLLVFTEMQWHDLKLFEREAQVLQKLSHPRIPQYRNYFLIDQQTNSPFCCWGLVQAYVPGQTLQALLEENHQFNERDVRQIAKEILQILVYLHELKPPVFHRDLKPSNLILDQSQHIWLVDFGAVQDQSAVTGRSFTVVGTVGYAPLEQFWGRSVAASDLYALGATCIHLLTGVAPVDLPQHNLRIHFRDRISFYSSFVSWIEKLTEPALEKRFGSAQEACEALEYETTPICGSIQTVCSTQSKKIQRSRPQLVVKQKSPQALRIEICELLPSTSNRHFLFAFYFFWGLMTCILLPLIGGAFAFVLAFLLAYLFAIGKILWETRHTNPENINVIRFDLASDCFEVTTRSLFSARKESGRSSAIRYFSITSSQVFINQHTSYLAWVIIIRANRNYTINWKLTEEECIWLVNEMQLWLSSK